MGADTVEPIFAAGGENDWRKKKSANHPHPYFIDGAISSGAPSIGNPAFPPIK
jgi:hypothetical protein